MIDVSACPGPELLQRLARGLASDAESALLERHVTSCAVCSSLIQKLIAEDRPASAAVVSQKITKFERNPQPSMWRHWFIATAAAVVIAVGLTAYFTWKSNPPSTGEVTFDLTTVKGEIVIRHADGREFRLHRDPKRRYVFPAGSYTTRFTDLETRLRPWPEQFTIPAGKEVHVALQTVGEQARYTGPTGSVNAVDFLSDKDLRNVSSGAGDFKSIVWNPATTGKPIPFDGHKAELLTQSVSPDGTLLATGEGGKTKTDSFEVRIWKLSTGVTMQKFDDHDDFVTAVAFTPDGKKVLTGLRGGELLARDLATSKAVRMTGHTAKIQSITIAPAVNRALSASADGKIIVWDLVKLVPVKEWQAPTAISSGVLLPDGMSVAVGGDDGLIRLWSIEDGAMKELAGHKGNVHALAVSADGKQLLSGGADATVRLWDLASGGVVWSDRHGGEVRSVALNRDGKHALSGSLDHTVRLWKLPE